jgi:APA family basic amino acid/polyamine antiporter
MIGTLTLDLDIAAELCNFGTFTSFIIVCVAVLILRKIDPDRPRPFKVPFSPWFPLAGIILCGGLMVYSMVIKHSLSALLFPVWILVGVAIYAGYGYKKNRQAEVVVEEDSNEKSISAK